MQRQGDVGQESQGPPVNCLPIATGRLDNIHPPSGLTNVPHSHYGQVITEDFLATHNSLPL